MHGYATLNARHLAKRGLKVVDTEMFNRARETAFKRQAVGHFVHHGGEETDVGQHDIHRTNRGVKGHFVDEILESRNIVIQHVQVHVKLAVIGLHFHPVKVNAA